MWTEEKRRKVFECGIFSVHESTCKSPALSSMVFSVIEASDWAIVIPVIETPKGRQFVMVRQWRHGSRCMSLEFPGGVFEPGENAQEAAARELFEETGYKPKKIKKLGEFSPNPAIMTNKAHFFLAEDLTGTGVQNLDKDEYVETVLIDAQEVIEGMGKAPYVHALMGAALALYNKDGIH